MIDIKLVFGWINWEYPSEITESSHFWTSRIADETISADERVLIIRDLAKSVAHFSNPLEQAEILVQCGVLGYQLGLTDEPAGWLDLAADLYQYNHDEHRFAVTLWLLFIVLRGTGLYRQAYDRARKARNLLTEIANERLLQKRIEFESWYRGRVLDITFDLVSSPEDMFECLFEFQGSSLSLPSSEIKSRIASQIQKKNFSQIDREMQLLLGMTLHSLDTNETGEALAFCGVVSWLLEDRSDATNFFRSAMTQYIPGSFRYAVVEWMYGLALFDNPHDTAHAITIMQKSMHEFDELRVKAVHENQMDKGDWFATYQSAMRRALRTSIENTKTLPH